MYWNNPNARLGLQGLNIVVHFLADTLNSHVCVVGGNDPSLLTPGTQELHTLLRMWSSKYRDKTLLQKLIKINLTGAMKSD